MPEIDKIDQKIMYQLDFNSRQSCSQIAKKVKVSSEMVNYRIKRLEKEGYISHYQVVVYFSRLNVQHFKLCLNFQHLESSKLNDIIKILKMNKLIKWIVECKGKWDMILSCETKTLEEIDLLKEEILAYFSNHIREKSLAILVRGDTYNRDYLIKDIASIYRQRELSDKFETFEIDDLDHAILKQLVQDARMSVVKIARNLKSTSRIITYRIKQLQKNRIILGYKVALNYEKLGIKFFKAFITFGDHNLEDSNNLYNYLASNKNVIHNGKMLSEWDLEAEFEVFSDEEIDNIIRDIKDRFANLIRKIDIVTIKKEHKFEYF